MSDSMQIESLWRYNAKFQPAWEPRFILYPDVGDLPTGSRVYHDGAAPGKNQRERRHKLREIWSYVPTVPSDAVYRSPPSRFFKQ